MADELSSKVKRSELDELSWSIVRGQVAKMERETVDFGANFGGY